MKNFVHLEREFARRQYDKPLLSAKRGLNHRHAESKRFSGGGLGNADHILSLYRQRDGFFLNGRGNFEIELVKNGKNVRRDAKVVEIGRVSHKINRFLILWFLLIRTDTRLISHKLRPLIF